MGVSNVLDVREVAKVHVREANVLHVCEVNKVRLGDGFEAHILGC